METDPVVCVRCGVLCQPYAGRVCRRCRNVQIVARRRVKRAADPAWHDAIKEADRAAKRQRYAEDPEYRAKSNAAARATSKKHGRRYELARRYGMTLEDWEVMFDAQERCCAICASLVAGSRGWCVDHDHRSGAVRGILCNTCNRALGLLKDSKAVLAAAIEYLESTATQGPEVPR